MDDPAGPHVELLDRAQELQCLLVLDALGDHDGAGLAAQAGRVEGTLDNARHSVSARIRPRPRHRLRNTLLGVAGSLVAIAITAGLVGRRRSTEPSPLARAGTAARDSLATGTEDQGGVTEVVAAGAAAAKSGAEAVGEDVTLGARTAKDAPADAVRERVEAGKDKVEAVKEDVTGKLVRLAVVAGLGLTAYILVMSVVVALLVAWIV